MYPISIINIVDFQLLLTIQLQCILHFTSKNTDLRIEIINTLKDKQTPKLVRNSKPT